MSEVQWSKQFEVGCQALNLEVAPSPFLAYLALLLKWNHVYNLTAVRQAEEMITKHLLDSLAIVPFIDGDRILDVGTGAGLPGIPLALYFRNKQFVLIDSIGKKTRFLDTVKRELKLENIEIVQTRVESYQTTQLFDVVTSRALTDLSQWMKWTRHILKPEGKWLAMKGQVPTTELALLSCPYQVHSYSVPGLDAQRCVVSIKKQNC